MASNWMRVLALLGLCLAHLAHLAAAAEPFRWDDRVQRGQLDNGLPYYIVSGGKEMGKQVALQLLVRVGSLDERDDQSGVAHMVEHMVFDATKAYPEGLRRHVEGLGLRIGQHYNAQTNFERTLYYLTINSERIDAGLDVLSQIAGGALIPAPGLERERQVILEEWRTKLGVRERMEKQRRAMLRAGSLYPERPTIGTEASIRQQPAAALQAFYADWYRPANMALIVVGNVDAEAVRQRIAARFGGLKPGSLPARNAADPLLQEQLRITRPQDAESGASQVGWVTRFAADKRQDSDGLRERILDRIAERSLRTLVRLSAEQLPAGVESLTVSKGELGETTASLGFAASVAVDGHRAGLRQILLVRERVRREGLNPATIRSEIEEVRRLNEKGPAQQAERDFNSWLQQLGEAVQAERILQDPQQKQSQIRHILAGLSVEEINGRARQWLDAPDRLLFMLAPGLSPLTLPTAAEVETENKLLNQQPLPPLVKAAKPEPAPAGMPQRASDGAILREEDLGEGVQRWMLENGDVLLWMPAPAEKTMRFAARSGAGYRTPGAPAWRWQLAAQLARDADLAGQTSGELGRWMVSHKVSLSQEQSETQLSYSAQAEPEQLEDLLQLYAARQTHSSLTMEALNAAGQQLARQAARRPDSAGESANREMRLLRYGDLPLDGYPDGAALKALLTPAALETVRAQWTQLSRQPATYFISGPGDAEQLRALARRYLAGIPRAAGKPLPSALAQRGGYHESRLAINLEPQSSVRAMGSQELRWTPERAMRTAILSRIAYRQLRQELREEQAGIYRLNYTLSLDPQHRLLSELSFTAAPQRLDALWAAAMQVLERLPDNLDEAMLQEEIARMRGDESKRATDGMARFHRLQLSYAQYGDARYLADSKQLVTTLTPDSVRAFARELRLVRDLAVVKVLPKPAAGVR